MTASLEAELAELAPAPKVSSGWPELDPAARHGLAGEILDAVEPHTEADPAALLATLLVGFGNLIGSGPHARADGAQHPGRLFAVIVGASSKARKGTSMRRIQPILAAADPGWAPRITSGLSTGEGLITAVADPVVAADGKQTDAGAPDKRLLVVEEEFARVLSVKGRESNTLSPILRAAWDDGTLRVLTKQARVATGAHISIIGHVTIDELRSRLTETDLANGFANRFLYVCAARTRLLPNGGNLDDRDVTQLGKRLAEVVKAVRGYGTLLRTPQAEERWGDLYHQLADDDIGGLLGAVVARSEAHLLRLAVTYTLLSGARRIDVEHLEAAWALWRYCRDSSAYIFGDSTGDRVLDGLLDGIRNAGPAGLTGAQQYDLFSRHTSAKELDRARKRLEQLGHITTRSEATGGRPSIVSFDARWARAAAPVDKTPAGNGGPTP